MFKGEKLGGTLGEAKLKAKVSAVCALCPFKLAFQSCFVSCRTQTQENTNMFSFFGKDELPVGGSSLGHGCLQSDTRLLGLGCRGYPQGCGSKTEIPNWVALVSGNMHQNLRFAPPVKF